MMKKYVFNGVEYQTERAVRDAVFAKDRKALSKIPKENVVEFWAKHGVVYVEEDETLETLKHQKALGVKQVFLNWRNNQATLISSLGFKVDSNERANTDIGGLLIAYESDQDKPITFRDADNEFHSLTYDQVKTLQLEIIGNGNYAYAQKWAFDAQIENSTSKDELDAIQVEFVGKDFTKQE